MHWWSSTPFLCEVNLANWMEFCRVKGYWHLFIYRRKDTFERAYTEHLYWMLVVAKEQLAWKGASCHMFWSSRLLSHHTCSDNFQRRVNGKGILNIKLIFRTICLKLFFEQVFFSYLKKSYMHKYMHIYMYINI